MSDLRRLLIVSLSILASASLLFAEAPSNDDRTEAISLEVGVQVAGTLLNATTEVDEPLAPGVARTVWYRAQTGAGVWELRMASRSGGVIGRSYLENDEGELIEIGKSAFRQSEDGEGSATAPFRSSLGIRYQAETDEVIWFQLYAVNVPGDEFSLNLSPIESGSPGVLFRDAITLPATVHRVRIDPTNAYRERAEPPSSGQGTVWSSWVLPEDGLWLLSLSGGFASLDAWQGNSLESLTRIPAIGQGPDIRTPERSPSRLIIDGSAGSAILVRVSSDFTNPNYLSIRRPTPGDLFLNATDLGEVAEASVIFSLDQELTLEPDEPNSPGLSRWLRWRAPASGTYQFSAQTQGQQSNGGSIRGLHPFVNLYQGDRLDSLLPVVTVPRNAGNPATSHHRLRRFRAVVGETYFIQAGVTPFQSVTSSGRGFFNPPTEQVVTLTSYPALANDDFSDAGEIGQSSPAVAEGSNVGATNEPGEVIEQFDAGNSVWHRWTPAAAGQFEIRINSAPGLVFTLFRGSSLSDLTIIKEKSFGFNPSPHIGVIRFDASEEEYHLRITGRSLAEGSYRAEFLPTSPPTNDHFLNAALLSGDLPITANGTTRFASLEFPQDGSRFKVDAEGESSIWWKWTAAESGIYELRADAHLGLREQGNPVGRDLTTSPGRLRFTAQAGLEYHFRVAHPRTEEREVSLILQPVSGLEYASVNEALDLGSEMTLTTPTLDVLGGVAFIDRQEVSGRAVYRWTPQSSGWAEVKALSGTGFAISAHTEQILRSSILKPAFIGNEHLDFDDQRYPSFLPARTIPGPLRATLKSRPSSVPAFSRGLMQVEAGQTYFLMATPTAAHQATPDELTPVQFQVTRAAAPARLLASEWRRLPNRNVVQATLSIDAPNGFVNGSLFLNSRRIWFDEADRISGDAYQGNYRVMIPAALGSGPTTALPLVGIIDRTGVRHSANVGEIDLSEEQPGAIQADRRGPNLIGVTGGKREITITGGGTSLTLEMAIADYGGSGFSDGEIILPGAFIGTALGQVSSEDDFVIPFNATHRVRGDPQVGLYQIEIPIPANVIAGNLRCRMRDRAGNLTGSWSGEGANFDSLASYSFEVGVDLPISLVKEETTDPVAPEITSATATHLTDAPEGGIDTSARITHPVGISRGRVVVFDQFGVIIASHEFDDSLRTEGSPQDGLYRLTLPTPSHRTGGAHWLSWEVVALDGRTTSLSEIGPLEIATSPFADQRNPALTRFQISASTVDLSTGPETLTVNLAAHDDRPGLTAEIHVSTSDGNLLASRLIDCTGRSLDCEAELILPRTTSVGISSRAEIEVTVTDASGRSVSYGRIHSPSWPDNLPPALALVPIEPDFLSHWFHRWTGSFEIPTNADRDQDGDGWSDLLEFAMATDPLTPAATDPLVVALPAANFATPSISTPGDPRLQTFSTQLGPWFQVSPERKIIASHLNHPFEVLIERSADLESWLTVEPSHTIFERSNPTSTSISAFLNFNIAPRAHWYRLMIRSR